jgi:hypothetical protein
VTTEGTVPEAGGGRGREAAESDREDAGDVYDEIAERNPDDVTRREAYEREMAERGRSDETRDVGDHLG